MTANNNKWKLETHQFADFETIKHPPLAEKEDFRSCFIRFDHYSL